MSINRRQPGFLTLVFAAFIAGTFPAGLIAKPGDAAALSSAEADYYKIITIPIPDDIDSGMRRDGIPAGQEAGGLDAARRDLSSSKRAYANPPKVKFTCWATGMHEVMGLAFNKKDGFLYAIQRGEITRLKDTDGRGHANVYETFCDDWGITGDYHEYPWMSKFDKDGNLWVLLTLTGSFTSDRSSAAGACR